MTTTTRRATATLKPEYRATLPARPEFQVAPVFPTTITTKEYPAGYKEGVQRYLIESSLTDLLKWVRKSARWFYLCETNTVTNVRSQMPSKNSKHHAYDAAYRLAAACGWDRETTRCHSVRDLVALCDAAAAALMTFDGPVMVQD